MANVDKYLILHEAVVNQAKARYPKHRGKGTSPEANKIISQQWATMSAGAPQSLKDADPKAVDWDKVKQDREKAKTARKKRAKKKSNFVV